MKRVFLAILTPLYIFASLGFTLQKQYCTGSQVDRGLNHCISKICVKCGSVHINQKDKNCCRNENRFVKNEKDQNIPESVFHPTPSTTLALPPYFLELSFNEFAAASEIIPINHAPPPGYGVAIYLRDRVFRI
ncbi:MAG TPA: hypothetical protein VMU83_19245 [Hanamia sp.]|nr:hypothetical protein [Hanamia sp.]